jgi:hypothetical protein
MLGARRIAAVDFTPTRRGGITVGSGHESELGLNCVRACEPSGNSQEIPHRVLARELSDCPLKVGAWHCRQTPDNFKVYIPDVGIDEAPIRIGD